MGEEAFDVANVCFGSVRDFGVDIVNVLDVEHVQSQLALLGSYSASVSMLRLPWDVARIVFGSTPSSFAILWRENIYINLNRTYSLTG